MRKEKYQLKSYHLFQHLLELISACYPTLGVLDLFYDDLDWILKIEFYLKLTQFENKGMGQSSS